MEERAIIVAAHPDDEVIGLGLRLPELARLAAVVHVTDGAPRTGTDFLDAGCANWQQYAALRRAEFADALRVSGARSEEDLCLWIPDQQAGFAIHRIAVKLARIVERLRPEIVFTHPYEGGHPDHDSVAVAVHAAQNLISAPHRFTILEFASYHAGPDGIEPECFLHGSGVGVTDRVLTAAGRERKRNILACYRSQERVLEQFPLGREPIRPAPVYDFSKPPHPGRLLYEQFDWGMDGARWRQLAAEALRKCQRSPSSTASE